MKLKHEGFSKNRLLSRVNKREIAFARAWKRENEWSKTLLHLVPDCQPRDAQVAATIIQWLGSNVGTAFLSEVLKEKTVRDALMPFSTRHNYGTWKSSGY